MSNSGLRGAARVAACMVAAVLLAPACGGANHSADLVKDLRGYSDGIRWRDFSASALRIAPARRDEFLDRHESLDDDLRVADWDMKRLHYSADGNRARIEIEWTWLLDSRGIVHTTVTRQWWSRHGRRWLLDREIRLRGDPMPGVADPASAGAAEQRRQARQSRLSGAEPRSDEAGPDLASH